jgi:hypothetical protein
MKNWKSLLLLALVFFAGVAVGVVGTRAVVRRVVQQAIAHPERVQAVIERGLTRKLRLDGEQQTKLRGILSDTRAQLDDLRGQFKPQAGLILSNANGQITALLTPEQAARFEELKRKNHPLLRALQENQTP